MQLKRGFLTVKLTYLNLDFCINEIYYFKIYYYILNNTLFE